MNISKETFEKLKYRHMVNGDPTINELGTCYNCEDLNYTPFILIEFNNGSYVITGFKNRLIVELVEELLT